MFSVQGASAGNRSEYEVTVHDTIEAVDPAEWNGLVERSDRAGLFHRHEWLAAVERELGYEPRHVFVRKDHNPIGLLPNVVRPIELTPFRRLSSVYPGYGGPVISTDLEQTLSLLFEAVPTRRFGRTIVHEVRANDADFLRFNDFLAARGYRPYRGECRHLLDLTQGHAEILENMSESRRSAIERGRNADHEIVEESLGEAEIERFYATYRRAMERLDATALPIEFFESFREFSEYVLLVTLRLDGEYAGGMLELLDEQRSTIYGFKAAVPEEYYGDGASELLYDHVIRWGIERGFETYDFGDSNPDFQNGLFMYKDSFGGRVVPSYIWERGWNPLWRPVAAGRRRYQAYRR